MLLLVILVNVGESRPGGAKLYVPGLIGFAILSAAFMSLVTDLVGQRESGVLKRRRASPVPAWVLIAGRTLTAVLASLAAGFLLLVVAGNGYGVAIRSGALTGLVFTVTLGAVVLAALGYALATAIRSVGSAQPVVALIVLPLFVISGVLVPDLDLPPALATVARVFPVEHIAHGLRRAFDTGAPLGFDGGDLLVLADWGAAGLLVAAARFAWLLAREGLR